jgi:hypothetical protein
MTTIKLTIQIINNINHIRSKNGTSRIKACNQYIALLLRKISDKSKVRQFKKKQIKLKSKDIWNSWDMLILIIEITIYIINQPEKK